MGTLKTESCTMKVPSIFSVLLLVALVPVSNGRKILEIQTRTATDSDADMNGGLTVEICNAGGLDSNGDDFQKGFVDVFYGSAIGECDGAVIGDGAAIMIVTHDGIDAWLGEWIRVILDDGVYIQCPIEADGWLDDFQTITLKCT